MFHPHFAVKIVLEHRLELFETDTFVVVVVVLFKFTDSDIRREVIFDEVEGLQIAIDG